jgi:predicted metal-dependent hydrolase
VQLELFTALGYLRRSGPDWVIASGRLVPLVFQSHRRARRYVLRVKPDGTARVTIPRGGSKREAFEFVHKNIGWIEKQLQKPPPPSCPPRVFQAGTRLLFRGEWAALALGADRRTVEFADQAVFIAADAEDWRPAIERHLWRLAKGELVARTWELAEVCRAFDPAAMQRLRRVTVRNQRSRWGSCSAKGTVSLNWRLMHTPAWVRDYLILHELTHLREMNHSPRFWQRVAQACPEYGLAETWLKQHAALLR